MTREEKIELINTRLSELIQFKSNLSPDNIDSFEKLKSDILILLDDNERVRFNQIDFYSETPLWETDDLPF